jgi:uncharacterized protein YegP (UPF0339 family)
MQASQDHAPIVARDRRGRQPEEGKVKYYYGKDKCDEWRWQLQTDNQKTIAVSPKGYNHERDCVAAIERVKATQDAAVVKLDRLV